MRMRLLGLIVVLTTVLMAASPAHAADKIYWGDLNTSNVRVGNLDGSGTASDLFGSNAARGIGIDAASNRLIFGDDQFIRSAGLDGTGLTSLFESQFPIGLTIDPAANKVYWANFSPGAIRVGNLDGSGAAADLFGGESGPKGVAIDPASGKIYWAAQTGNAIRVGNLDGSGAAATLFGGESFAEGVALDVAAGKIYWGANNEIRVGNLDGSGTAATLFADGSSDGIAIDAAAGKLYWTSTGGSWVRVANLDGSGSPQTLFQDAGGSATAYPAILKAPVAAGAPTLGGDGSEGNPLTCGKGAYAPDLIGAFLFRAAGIFTYSWTMNGAPVSGATGGTLVPESSGGYACTVTGSNPAGSAAPQTSPSVEVTVSEACERLRKKLKKQKRNRARAGSKRKRNLISRNIADTHRRLDKNGC